jgi:hypothetical protein
LNGYQHVDRNPRPQYRILNRVCPLNTFEQTHFNIIFPSFHYMPPLDILCCKVHVNYIHKIQLLPHRNTLCPLQRPSC